MKIGVGLIRTNRSNLVSAWLGWSESDPLFIATCPISWDTPGLAVEMNQNNIQLDVIEWVGVSYSIALEPFGELIFGTEDLVWHGLFVFK